MSALPPTRMLFTSGGGPGAWGLLSALRSMPGREAVIFAQDPDEADTLGGAFADHALQLPPARAADYVDLLLACCRRNAIDVLLPVYDGELRQIAARRPEFDAAGVAVLLPPDELVKQCIDKAALYSRLRGTEFVPRFVIARTARDVDDAVADLGYPRRRVCLKPVNLAGGRGVHVLDATVDSFETRMLTKPGVTRCTATEFSARRAAGPERFDLLLSEYLPGDELGIDLLADNGRVLEMVIRRKAGASVAGNPMRMEFRDIPSEREWVVRLTAELRVSGLVNIDARYDDAGSLRLLEINPRPSACIGMACARVHVLAWAVDLLLGTDIGDRRRYYSSRPAERAMRVLADVVFSAAGPRLINPLGPTDVPLSQPEHDGLLAQA